VFTTSKIISTLATIEESSDPGTTTLKLSTTTLSPETTTLGAESHLISFGAFILSLFLSITYSCLLL
jgi:hypothetical protein